MFKRFIQSLILSAAFTFSVFAAPSEIIFCESISSDLKPVNPKTEFDTNKLAFIFQVDKPFGDMNILLSLYRINDAGNESFDSRVEVPVNPKWNCMGYPEINLPEGKFRFEFSKTDGELLASGTVSVLGENVAKDAPIEEVKAEQVKGKTVEDYFKEFDQKAKKAN